MADLSTLETIKASDKPIEDDFSYIYAESVNKAFIRIAKEELKKLILDGEYTNEEIDQKISTIPKFTTKVVSNLPTTDISETTVYLVSSGNDSENLYTEYININGLWEILGTQKSTFSGSAKDVTYDDTETKLGATNVQDAFGKLSATVNDKLDSSKLTEAINTALAQAKESGEFKGDKGDKGDSATDEQITNAVETYLTENPVSNSKKYAMRLLREVTIEESVTEVMISEDDDGNEIDAEILIISINPFNTNQNSSTGVGNLSILTDSFENLRVNTIGEIYRTTTSETPENSWAFYCAIVKLTKGCVEYVTGTAEKLDNTFAMNTVNKSFKKGVVYNESYAPSTKLKGIGVANHWNAQVLGVGTQIRVYGGKEV